MDLNTWLFFAVIALIFAAVVIMIIRPTWWSATSLALPSISFTDVLEMLQSNTFKVEYDGTEGGGSHHRITYRLASENLLVRYVQIRTHEGVVAEGLQIKVIGCPDTYFMGYMGDEALHFDNVRGVQQIREEGQDLHQHDAAIIRRVRTAVASIKTGPLSQALDYVDPLPDQMYQ